MKRNDIVLLVVLFGLLIGWRYIDSHVIKKHFYKNAGKPAAVAVTNTTAAADEPTAPAATNETALASAPAAESTNVAAAAAAEVQPLGPEQTATLENDKIAVTFSSRGGSVKSVTVKQYRSTIDPASGPVVLDFADAPALAYKDLPGLSGDADFAMTVDTPGKTVRFERATAQGLQLVRTYALDDSYQIVVTDSLLNQGGTPVALAAHSIRSGPMRREKGHQDSVGFVSLGVDTLAPGGDGVQHWGAKLSSFFKADQKDTGADKLPARIDREPADSGVDWVAAKNKYFLQIIAPDGGGEGALLHARREVSPRELADPDFKPRMTPIEEVSVDVLLPATTIAAGQGLPPRRIEYYVGPTKYDELHPLSLNRVDVMELGMWRPIGKLLLRVLNFIHHYLWPHNYGLAIILLTIIVRTVFWPITHKSTESMKRMAEVQPLVNQIREKYKDNPQRMQQEIMALYKERKINPIGGCLPMLIQIPIFIALFMVLRSAIELRFAQFLWIKDLSEPENLLVGTLGFPLNILPLLMAVTMFVQQKMTPTAGDPQQAKMMRIMMPAMMLFFLYKYASGLALYWTTQNLLMIFQQLVIQRAKKRKAAAAA